MRILITGVAGFIGQALAQRLPAEDKHRVSPQRSAPSACSARAVSSAMIVSIAVCIVS